MNEQTEEETGRRIDRRRDGHSYNESADDAD